MGTSAHLPEPIVRLERQRARLHFASMEIGESTIRRTLKSNVS